MVKAGLEVGDIFDDCGMKYKVLSVNADGTYISTRVNEDPKAEEPAKEEKVEEPKAEEHANKPAPKPRNARRTRK